MLAIAKGFQHIQLVCSIWFPYVQFKDMEFKLVIRIPSLSGNGPIFWLEHDFNVVDDIKIDICWVVATKCFNMGGAFDNQIQLTNFGKA